MNETENNTNIESEDNLNDDLLNNKPDGSSDGMDAFGFMDTNQEEVLADIGSDSDGSRNVSDNVGTESTETQSNPPAENTDVSDGNAAHMEGNTNVETDVSSNDLYLPAASVSSGDTCNTYYYSLSCSCGDGALSPFTEEDALHINDTLDGILFTANGILFFILFAWAEKKISNGIRKLFNKMNPAP